MLQIGQIGKLGLKKIMTKRKRFGSFIIRNIQKNLEGIAVSRGIVGLRDKSLRQVYDERKHHYSNYADITVNCKGKSPEELSREILTHFLEMQNG